ncbi:NAD(P)/FAD-dependent oxidoreductase [Parasphingopyxis algicola]|uniref:NAD(P)/FAD-dependent oxidoreductase n=1 Tax=Parasphingopyxis algicola TaxID=2026624 RepID=UPI001C40B71F|nr:FAD-dependent oxidoreductase [Parasphingopyxis algicola]
MWRASCVERIDPVPLSNSLTVDLAIVGGGFTGCSAALEAALAGASVCLLEADEIGFGGSGRNVGLVNSGLWLTPDKIISKLGENEGGRLLAVLANAPDKVFALIAEHEIQCEATRSGTLHCAHSPAGVKDLENRYRQGTEMGAPYRLFDAQEASRRTGSESFWGALFDPRAGTIQPLAYCKGLARAAVAHGAQIFQNSPVTAFSYANDAWRVDVDGKVVTAKSLLIATNAYHFNAKKAFEPQIVRVGYCQFATVPLSIRELARTLPGKEGCWDTALVMSSFRLDDAGRLIVGGLGDLEGPARAIHEHWARKKLRELFPQLQVNHFEYCWGGRIAMTSDHIPKFVEFSPNALACFGYSGRGIGPGTVFGAAAAWALLTGNPDHLPLPAVARHDERFASARETYYEVGAAIVHATGLPL